MISQSLKACDRTAWGCSCTSCHSPWEMNELTSLLTLHSHGWTCLLLTSTQLYQPNHTPTKSHTTPYHTSTHPSNPHHLPTYPPNLSPTLTPPSQKTSE